MLTPERRLIVDVGFDLAVENVIDTFLKEGFTIEPARAGNLSRHLTSEDSLRCAVLEALLPEAVFTFRRLGSETAPALGCRIIVYELRGACTLLTVSGPGVDYPTFAWLAPNLEDRIGSALRALTPHGAAVVAA
jgi:hypothetical protein